MTIGNESEERRNAEAQQRVFRRQITKFMITLMIIGSIAALLAGVMISNP